jgi:signal transduction histidine kinase
MRFLVIVGASTRYAVEEPEEGEKVKGMRRDHPVPPDAVLVVDDEPDIVNEVLETLEDEGFACLGAGDGEAALALLRERPDIGIVVSDIRMPGMDGLALADEAVRLRERGRDLSVIMVTGHAGMAEAVEALKIGVDDFLTKPISPSHLVHSVERSRELVRLRWRERAFKVALETEVAERTAEVRTLMAELERRNQDLAVANRAKDEFLDMISHEINTPLNAILGFGQLLRDDMVAAGDAEASEAIAEILKAGNSLHRKLQAILSMASARRGDDRLHLDRFSADEMLALVSDGLRPAAEAKGVTVRHEIVDGPIDIRADLGRLSQAVRFLADNAVRHSPDGGVVTLRAGRQGSGGIAITVMDDGPGMTPEQVTSALEPLTRGGTAEKAENEGVGLGLPLARLFAELHGGTLEVESAPGEGTTATLTLPREVSSDTARDP